MPSIHPDVLSAYRVLDGEPLPGEIAFRLAEIGGADVLDLASLANKVRERFSPEEHVCSILNVKSGSCDQDCRYCAQSARYRTGAEVYPLLPQEEILRRAGRVYAEGVKRFGLVASGKGYAEPDGEFEAILSAAAALKREFPGMEVCASLGILSERTAEMLAGAGIVRYNHNLQVVPGRYSELAATTHSAEERVQTLRRLARRDVGVCSGAILGLGETMRERVELAYVLKDLGAGVIPLNVLIPVPGTPLEFSDAVPAVEIVKTFAIYRLVHPGKVIKFAAGRETAMKDWQGLAVLAGANGILTGGYLTTRGRGFDEDRRLIAESGKFRG